jgi:hypothetical protein
MYHFTADGLCIHALGGTPHCSYQDSYFRFPWDNKYSKIVLLHKYFGGSSLACISR